MRRMWIARSVALIGVVATATIVFAVSGDAQVQQNTVTVKKVVQGPVPANTTFTVTLTCVPNPGTPTTHTVHFDAKGNRTDTNSSGVLGLVPFTATGTQTGGAP